MSGRFTCHVLRSRYVAPFRCSLPRDCCRLIWGHELTVNALASGGGVQAVTGSQNAWERCAHT